MDSWPVQGAFPAVTLCVRESSFLIEIFSAFLGVMETVQGW